MLNLEDILKIDPFSLKKEEKERILLPYLKDLSALHSKNCKEYRNILHAQNVDIDAIATLSDIPFLPVNIFKELLLKSIDDSQVFKTMTSSGTTSGKLSKIILDKETALNQQKALLSIITNALFKKRMPMLIIDSKKSITDRKLFSARGASILGFSLMATDKCFALNDDMSLNLDAIEDFLEKHSNEKIFIFGFTFMIWQYLVEKLQESTRNLNLANSVLVHGGGWKKLADRNISNVEFKKRLYNICNIEHVHNYYGMVEQTGSIFIECSQGHLHCPLFSDILIRDEHDLSVKAHGDRGIIELISVLPLSYPGHCLLTEDLGVILGEDDCPCGLYGKYFKVLKRVKNTKIRGCSDAYA